MQLNSIELIDRHNRPGVNQKVGLQVYFVNDGVFVDPVTISAVTIFQKSRHTSPSSVLDSNNLLNTSAVSGAALMNFGVSSADSGAGLSSTRYTGGTAASGVYRISTGRYVVVLDGTVNLSGVYNLDGQSTKIANTATSATDYIDVWTVKFVNGSNFQTVINDFTLFDNTFFSITQPLLLHPSNKLSNKHLVLGEKRDLKVTTDITIENKDIDDSIKNIFKDSVITSAMMQITKLNDGDHHLGSRVEVSGFGDTSSLIQVTSDNTIILNWDTNQLATHAKTANGTLGSLTGTYEIIVKYTLLNETIKTDPMYLVVY